MRKIAVIFGLIVLLSAGSSCDLLGGGNYTVGTVGWGTGCTEYRGNIGSEYTYTFPAGGSENGVWGTDIYTDDSDIGTAAVHAGLITFAAGGTVTIRILDGQDSYTGSTRNGVTTSDYGSWYGSFEFVQ